MLTTAQRKHNYATQNGLGRYTPRQMRRIKHKGNQMLTERSQFLNRRARVDVQHTDTRRSEYLRMMFRRKRR